MQEYVAGFLFSEDKSRIALIEKRQPAWQAGRLNGIGGKIEADETALEAMLREFAEETGVITTAAIWYPFVLIEGEGFCVHFFFGASDLVECVRTVEAEEVAIYPVDPLPEKVLHNLRWLIPMALDEKLDLGEVVRVVEG